MTRKTAVADNATSIKQAEADLDQLLADPTTDGAAIAAARGRIDLAHAQRARAEKADQDAAEAVRIARIDEITNSVRDGHLRQQVIDVLSLRSDAIDALRKLHRAVDEHNDELYQLHRELQALNDLPDHIEIPTKRPGSRGTPSPGRFVIDGASWGHAPDLADAIVTEAAMDAVSAKTAAGIVRGTHLNLSAYSPAASIRRPLDVAASQTSQATTEDEA